MDHKVSNLIWEATARLRSPIQGAKAACQLRSRDFTVRCYAALGSAYKHAKGCDGRATRCTEEKGVTTCGSLGLVNGSLLLRGESPHARDCMGRSFYIQELHFCLAGVPREAADNRRY